MWLFEPDRYFFHITNDRTSPASEVVSCANDRCDQENLVAQLQGGVKAMAMPAGDLVSNGAYMVMAGLAWSLKAWAALLLPEGGRWAEKHRTGKRSPLRVEFSTFCVAMIRVPCQIVRTAGRIVYRLPSWNPWQGVFLRLVERLHGRRLCRAGDGVKPGSGCPGAVPIGSELTRGGVVMSDRGRGNGNRVAMARAGESA